MKSIFPTYDSKSIFGFCELYSREFGKENWRAELVTCPTLVASPTVWSYISPIKENYFFLFLNNNDSQIFLKCKRSLNWLDSDFIPVKSKKSKSWQSDFEIWICVENRFTKFLDSSIFGEVFPSKRNKMFFEKISTYTGIQALKCRTQTLFLIEIQNSSPISDALTFNSFSG